MKSPGFFVRLATLALFAGTFGFGPCGGAAAESLGGSSNAPDDSSRGFEGNGPAVPTDSGTPANKYQGHPLCQVVDARCMPDEENACSSLAGDAGDAGAVRSCRLVRDETSLIVAPTCGAAPSGGEDGAACKTGEDCAPGFDCIEGAQGGVCRHYCCSGSCQTWELAGPRFCDIQKLVDANYRAPMCIPLKPCALLTPGECSATETCAIVDEDGASGCVMVGSAQVGDACDELHCASGLTCLGQIGNRRCYELCRVGTTACGMAQTCKTSTIFLRDPEIGVCQTP